MRFARHPEVLWRSTSQGPVVLLGDREPACLRGSAAVVWELLDDAMDRATVEAEARSMVGEAANVGGGLDELVTRGLVVWLA